MGPRGIAIAAAVLMTGFVIVLVVLCLAPNADGFRNEIAKEVGKVALQMLGVSLLAWLFSELLRARTERADFARRARSAYSRAKACRRRLKRGSDDLRTPLLERLEEIQLDFEDLRDEAERIFGSHSEIRDHLSSMERYLNDVVDDGFAKMSNRSALADFVARPQPTSRFAQEFRNPFREVRRELR